METVPMFVGGRDHAAVGNQWFDSDDSFAGKPWGRVARGGVADAGDGWLVEPTILWTRDIGRALRTAQRIESGTVWGNTYRVVSFMAPFGGVATTGNPFVLR